MSDQLAPSNQSPAGSNAVGSPTRIATQQSGNPQSGHSKSGAKSAGRLAINAAFMREIKEDNRQLKTLWDRMLPMLSHEQTTINHWAELISGLAELRDQLAIHFSLEEAYGYFDDAVDIAPHLSFRAETLRAQHSTLFEQIRDLADLIVELNVETAEHVAKLIRRFHSFQANFESHEESELRLILQSFDDDLGVGD